jgi:hypothetical protein
VLRSTGSSALCAALVVAAIGIAGCGGGSSTLSTSQYESRGVGALKPLLSALNSLKASPTDPNGWAGVQSASRAAGAKFAKLKAPSSISSLNSRLAASLGDMGTAAGRLSGDISKHNAAAARVDLGSYSSALQRYGGVINQLEAKGVKFIGA